MAIEIKYNSEFEYIFENAYAKIEDVQFSVERDECHVNIRIYANEIARQAKETKQINGVGKLTAKFILSDLKVEEFSINAIKKACYERLMDEHVLFKGGKALLD